MRNQKSTSQRTRELDLMLEHTPPKSIWGVCEWCTRVVMSDDVSSPHWSWCSSHAEHIVKCPGCQTQNHDIFVTCAEDGIQWPHSHTKIDMAPGKVWSLPLPPGLRMGKPIVIDAISNHIWSTTCLRDNCGGTSIRARSSYITHVATHRFSVTLVCCTVRWEKCAKEREKETQQI